MCQFISTSSKYSISSDFPLLKRYSTHITTVMIMIFWVSDLCKLLHESGDL